MTSQNSSHSDATVVVPDTPVKVAFKEGLEYTVSIHLSRKPPHNRPYFPINIHCPLAKAIIGKKEGTIVIYKAGRAINTVKIVKIF